MKDRIRKIYSLLLPVLAGAVFLLYPSQAKANDIIDGILGWFADTVQAFIEFIFGSCPRASHYLDKYTGENSCWICKLFDKIFDAINLLASAVYDQVHLGCMAFLGVLLAIYILFRVGKGFLSFQAQDPGNFYNQIGKTFFRTVVVCAFLLQPAGVIGYWIVSPFVELAVSFNRVILDGFVNGNTIYTSMSNAEIDDMKKWVEEQITHLRESNAGEGPYLTDEEKERIKADIKEQADTYTKYLKHLESEESHSLSVLNSCTNVDMTASDAAEDRKLFNDQIRASLECMIKGLYSESAYSLAVAAYMICHSFNLDGNGHLWWPNWGTLLSGIAIWFVGFIIIVMFAFKIMDATVRMGVLCALLPLLLVAWVFPVSAEYTKQGAKIMLQVMLTYIITAIVMALVIVIMMKAFSDNADGFELRESFNINDTQSIANHVGISTGVFFAGILSLILALLTMGVIDKIVYEYGGVDFGKNASDSVGGMVVRITTMSAQAASRGARLGATWTTTKVQDMLTARKISNADKQSKGAATKNSYNASAAGTGATGGDQGKNGNNAQDATKSGQEQINNQEGSQNTESQEGEKLENEPKHGLSKDINDVADEAERAKSSEAETAWVEEESKNNGDESEKSE